MDDSFSHLLSRSAPPTDIACLIQRHEKPCPAMPCVGAAGAARRHQAAPGSSRQQQAAPGSTRQHQADGPAHCLLHATRPEISPGRSSSCMSASASDIPSPSPSLSMTTSTQEACVCSVVMCECGLLQSRKFNLPICPRKIYSHIVSRKTSFSGREDAGGLAMP